MYKQCSVWTVCSCEVSLLAINISETLHNVNSICLMFIVNSIKQHNEIEFPCPMHSNKILFEVRKI